MNERRILLLSAYDAGSHQQWRQILCDMFPHYQWTCLALPARHFAWRVRGNSLSWAFNHRHQLTDNYDLVIATSLTDLASLRGFVPELAGIPTLVYFHENQFAYPTSAQQHASIEPAMVNLYSALCADLVAFNSEWNRSSFLQGAQSLLGKLPDHVPAGLVEQVRARSFVLPVPLPDRLFTDKPCSTPRRSGCVQIIWNHRHEYDKGPDLLLLIVSQLVQSGLPFRMHLLGQRFRQRPAAFDVIDQRLNDYYLENAIEPGINHFVKSRAEYEHLLSHADMVLSTALHDFYGLSMLEATALGCYPIAPDALAYPEYLPAAGLYPVKGLTLDEQATAAVQRILTHANHCRTHHNINMLSATELHTTWQQTFLSLFKS